MTFQLITKARASVNPTPGVTITEGAIYFNKAAVEEFDVANYENAELYADVSGGKVALKLLEDPTPSANKIRSKQEGRANRRVSAQGWIKQLGLQPGFYPVSKGKDATLVFNHALDGAENAEAEEATVPRRGRPRKAA